MQDVIFLDSVGVAGELACPHLHKFPGMSGDMLLRRSCTTPAICPQLFSTSLKGEATSTPSHQGYQLVNRYQLGALCPWLAMDAQPHLHLIYPQPAGRQCCQQVQGLEEAHAVSVSSAGRMQALPICAGRCCWHTLFCASSLLGTVAVR